MPVVNNVYSTSVTTENISRHELLAWVNDCLQSNLTKIEEMSTGAAYCQLTDFLYPDKVPLKKVKWNSRSDVDWMNNWRVLLHAWKIIGIDKPVQVQNLMRAKFQDNFEFLQWFKKFFDANYDGHEYDPLAARNYEEFPATLPGGGAKKPPASAAASRPAVPAAAAARPPAGPRPARHSVMVASTAQSRARTAQAKPTGAAPAATSTTARRPSPRMTTPASSPLTRPASLRSPGAQQQRPQTNGRHASGASAASKASPPQLTPTAQELNRMRQHTLALEAQNADLKAQLGEEREKGELFERERNFYYDKLRTIEILCGSCALPAGGGTLRVNEVQAILWDCNEGASAASSRASDAASAIARSPLPRGDLASVSVPPPPPRLDSPDAAQLQAMVADQQEKQQQQQQNMSMNNNDNSANNGLDIAHLEDTFLLDAGNTTGQGQQLLLLQQQDASLPILDLSDEKDTAAAVGEQNQTSIVGEEDNAGEKLVGPNDTYNASQLEERAPDAHNMTHPVIDGGAQHHAEADDVGEDKQALNSTYAVEQQQMGESDAEPMLANTTQTIEEAQLLNLTHPVANSTAMIPAAEHPPNSNSLGGGDDSSLLLELDSAGATHNIIDEPPSATKTDKTESTMTGNEEVEKNDSSAQQQPEESAV